MRNLTSEILALPYDMDGSEGPIISRTAVLSIVEKAFVVEIDRSQYQEIPADADPRQLETLAIASTVYNLIGEMAVRWAHEDTRKEAAEYGLSIPSPQELYLMAEQSGNPAAPTSDYDLIPRDRETVMAIGEIMDHLAHLTLKSSRKGLASALAERLPGELGL